MADRKQEFLNWLSRDLDAVDAQLDEWRAQHRDESTMGAKFDSDDRLSTLEQRREDIRRRSKELEDFDGDEWERARRELEQARDDLQHSLDDARNHTRH